MVLLPDIAYEEAMPIAEKIQRRNILPVIDKTVTVTVNIGLSELQNDDDYESLFYKADEAMYKAKTTGRDRVVC